MTNATLTVTVYDVQHIGENGHRYRSCYAATANYGGSLEYDITPIERTYRVGLPVMVDSFGKWRPGKVTALGRSRVTVEYQRNQGGYLHTKTFVASLVMPLDEWRQGGREYGRLPDAFQKVELAKVTSIDAAPKRKTEAVGPDDPRWVEPPACTDEHGGLSLLARIRALSDIDRHALLNVLAGYAPEQLEGGLKVLEEMNAAVAKIRAEQAERLESSATLVEESRADEARIAAKYDRLGERELEATVVTPGHPVRSGAGYDCACGECTAARGQQVTPAPVESDGNTRTSREYLRRVLTRQPDGTLKSSWKNVVPERRFDI